MNLFCFRMAEHEYVSKRANEERQKRADYRPIIEHDVLLWQRARNQVFCSDMTLL